MNRFDNPLIKDKRLNLSSVAGGTVMQSSTARAGVAGGEKTSSTVVQWRRGWHVVATTTSQCAMVAGRMTTKGIGGEMS